MLERWLEEQGWCAHTRAPTIVELGFGASSITAQAWFTRMRARLPEVRCVGVEVDPVRVAQAQRESAMPGVTWKQGGFDFEPPVRAHGVDMVRALNVLRQYAADDAPAAHALMAQHLNEGGLLIEGSCDRQGHRCVVHIQRCVGGTLRREALLCVVDLEAPFAPRMLRDWLPQDLRRGVGVTHAVFSTFLNPWMACFEELHAPDSSSRFTQSARMLASRVEDIHAPEWMIALGALCWSPVGGVPVRCDLIV